MQNDQIFLREVVGTFLDEEMFKGLVPKSKESEHSKDDKMQVDQPEKTGSDPHANGAAKPQLSEAEIKHRREVVSLVQQLCVMGKNVQLPARMALFRSLSDRGILFAVQWALGQPESDPEGLHMISAAGEVLTTLLDHDVNGVRGHALKQLGPPDSDKNSPRKIDHDTILSVLCRVLVKSRDLAVQSQIAESLRSILDVPPNDALDQHVSLLVHLCNVFADYRPLISQWARKSFSARRMIQGQSGSWNTSTNIARTYYSIHSLIYRTSRMLPVSPPFSVRSQHPS